MLALDLNANRQAQACLNAYSSSEPSSLGLPSDCKERVVGGTRDCPLPPPTGQAREEGGSRQLRLRAA